MTIQEVAEFLLFILNKKNGTWYTPDEVCSILDRGQMSLYSDLQPKYSTSEHIKDALSPFRATYDFTPSNTVSGVIVVPSNSNFLNLLDIQITFQISNRTVYWSIPMVNEDEKSAALNSQVDPVSSASPIGEVLAPRFYKIYPIQGYTGTVTYFRRPVKPVFAYTVISQRVIVYDPVNSVQLEWSEEWLNAIIVKALLSAGINISSGEIATFAEQKSQENFQGFNRF